MSLSLNRATLCFENACFGTRIFDFKTRVFADLSPSPACSLEMLLSWETGQNQNQERERERQRGREAERQRDRERERERERERSKKWSGEGEVSSENLRLHRCNLRVHRCTPGLHRRKMKDFLRGPQTRFAASPDHLRTFLDFDWFPKKAASEMCSQKLHPNMPCNTWLHGIRFS